MSENWDKLKARFVRDVQKSYDQATAWVDAAIKDDPEAVKQKVARTLSALKGAGARLQRAKDLLPNPPKTKADGDLVVRYAEIKGLYDAILSGIGINAVQLDAEKEIEAGFIPAAVVLTIGVLGLTAIGVAWAVANYEHAAALRDQAGFLVKELEARQEAMRTGENLPDSSGYPNGSTTNQDKKPDGEKGGWGWVWALLGLGTVAGAAIALPKLAKKAR